MSYIEGGDKIMSKNATTKINEVVEGFMGLSSEDKEYAVEIIEKQLMETKRERIAQKAKEATANYRKGRVRAGNVKELYEDLEGD